MKRISFGLTILVAGLFLILLFPSAWADPPSSLRQPHPFAWMHNLPTGELPGWSKNSWLNFEVSNGNVWNAPLIMNDLRTGDQYEYVADYEQISTYLEIGHAFFERLGVSVEVPYADRNGGVLDNVIDSFHLLIGNRRFNREYYPKYQDLLSVKTNGVDYFTDDDLADGVSNINLKLKYWLIKWMGSKTGSCPCGISVASQTKFPTVNPKRGGTTGSIDQSYLLHIGVPLFSASAMWLSAGYTDLGKNPAIKNWPRENHIMMYELNFNLAFTDNWGLVLSGRAESPFLKRDALQYYDTSTNPAIIARNRAASGWNSLVRWRGTDSIGIFYRSQAGDQIQLQMAEDWGIGPYDATDDVYSNGAPDVNFVLQTHISW